MVGSVSNEVLSKFLGEVLLSAPSRGYKGHHEFVDIATVPIVYDFCQAGLHPISSPSTPGGDEQGDFPHHG